MFRPVSNPPNPWANHTEIEWLGAPPEAELEVWEEVGKSILSKNKSPDLPFTWSVNPYRGCFHGCAYCYARPTHQYLGFGAGSDFDRRIVVKTNAAELLETAFERRSWRGEPLVFSGVTDCYQPLEASYQLTRQCLEVCLRYGNPVTIITKGALIRRDIDVLQALNERAGAIVFVSIPFSSNEMARKVEPHASAVSQRFVTLEKLHAAGITTGVAVAPVIPGLNDDGIPNVLERAAKAGATHAFMTLLRLPAETRPVFLERLHELFPEREKKVLNALQSMRGGMLNSSRFGERMKGRGPRWEAISQLFRLHCRKHGFNAEERAPESRGTFRRPGQLELF